MTRTTLAGWVALASLTVAAVPVAAHHSFAAVFDVNRPLDLTGTLTRLEWTNPHAWIYIDVENEAGEAETWGLEMGSPNGLVRRGWNRNTIQVGDEITVTGYRARDNTLRGAVITVTLSTGEQLFGAQDPA